MIAGEEIPLIFKCSFAMATLYSYTTQFGWAHRIPFQLFCSLGFKPSFTDVCGKLSFTMSTEAKWSDEVLAFCCVGLLGCQVYIAVLWKPQSHLCLQHWAYFIIILLDITEKHLLFFGRKHSPTPTLDSFLLFASSAVSKSFVKKAHLFGPGTETADTQLVILIAWLVGVGGTDNVKISSTFQICFPPTVSRQWVWLFPLSFSHSQ